MTHIVQSLFFAGLILAAAIAASYGLISEDSAQTATILLGGTYVAITGAKSCCGKKGARA